MGQGSAQPEERRPRRVVAHRFPPERRLVTAAVRAGRRIVPMHGLLDVDITDARRELAATQPPLSLTAFVVASVARAAARHPEVHAYRDWCGRLIVHQYVDVQTLIEVPTAHGPFGLVHLVRDADIKDVAAISAELRAVKVDPSLAPSGRALARFAPVLGRLPGAYRLMYLVMGRSRAVRAATGTVQVSAVGMFAGGGGYAVAPPTLASLLVVVGGASARPRVVAGQVTAREVLDLTVTMDHNVVDGAPAARFAATLRELIESAHVLVSYREH